LAPVNVKLVLTIHLLEYIRLVKVLLRDAAMVCIWLILIG
jgi:hypothetical protein